MSSARRCSTAELRVARGSGAGQAAGLLVAGLTVVACLMLGTESVRSGTVDGVLLAVLVLTPLAAFDLVAPLPDAVRRWAAVTAATTRIRELLDTEPGRAANPSDSSPDRRGRRSVTDLRLLRRLLISWCCATSRCGGQEPPHRRCTPSRSRSPQADALP